MEASGHHRSIRDVPNAAESALSQLSSSSLVTQPALSDLIFRAVTEVIEISRGFVAADCPKNTLNLKAERALKSRRRRGYGKLPQQDQNFLPGSTPLPPERTVAARGEDTHPGQVKTPNHRTHTELPTLVL